MAVALQLNIVPSAKDALAMVPVLPLCPHRPEACSTVLTPGRSKGHSHLSLSLPPRLISGAGTCLPRQVSDNEQGLALPRPHLMAWLHKDSRTLEKGPGQCHRAAQLAPQPSSWGPQKHKTASEAWSADSLLKAAQSAAEQAELALDT